MSFTQLFVAGPDDIDELDHVNNAVWVRWIQDPATAHWQAVAPLDHRQAYVWVVTRHKVDYRGNVGLGDVVMGQTWVPHAPTGARFDRHVRFTDAVGKMVVEAVTTWALIDRATGRLLRIRPAIASPFLD